MDPARWKRLEELFHEAEEKAPDTRDGFLREACGDDKSLFAEIQNLLNSRAGSHVDRVVSDAAVSTLSTLPNLENYRLLRVLGEGGMGVVYEAEQQQPRRLVALKLIRSAKGASERLRRLFQREAEALARLQHPGIATIFESGVSQDGQPFLAMELLQGEVLSDWMSANPAAETYDNIFLRARLQLFAGIAEAISYAHQNGVIHRDIKPQNIFVLRHGSSQSQASTASTTRSQITKILDFGLARISAEQSAATMTEAGVVQGSVPYMSPEQARGDSQKIDVRTDVYALGVMLYELLTGHHPYLAPGVGFLEAIAQILETPVKRFRAIGRTDLDADLETILCKAMEKEPSRRYQSVAGFLGDLERYQNNQTILARPTSTLYTLSKLIQRNRWPVAAVGIALAALVAFSISTYRQNKRIQLEAEASQQVSEFMVNIFRNANPGEAGRVLSAKELLLAGRKQLGKNLTTQPEVRARLLDSIGNAFIGISSYAEAQEVLQESLAIREKLYGADSKESLLTLKNLHDAYHDQGKTEQSIVTGQRLLVLTARYHGAESEKVMQANRLLGQDYILANQPDKAEGPVRKAEELARKLPNISPRDLSDLQFDLSRLLRQQRRFTEAVGPAEEATRMAERDGVVGNLASAYNQLGTTYNLAGKSDAAAKYLQKALEKVIEMYGPLHPNVAIVRANYGSALEKSGKREEAIRELRQAVGEAKTTLGPDHPRLTDLRKQLAEPLEAAGATAEAERELREGIRIAEKAYGQKHGLTGQAKLLMGGFLLRRGQFGEARKQLTAAEVALVAVGNSVDIGRVRALLEQLPGAKSTQKAAQ